MPAPLSIREIARKTFSCRATVSNRLKKYGIPIRKQRGKSSIKGQVGYGTKKQNSKLAENKKECAIIQKIIELRKMGLSYHKIADVLNAMGTKTRNHRKGSKWHATTVMNLIKQRDLD